MEMLKKLWTFLTAPIPERAVHYHEIRIMCNAAFPCADIGPDVVREIAYSTLDALNTRDAKVHVSYKKVGAWIFYNVDMYALSGTGERTKPIMFHVSRAFPESVKVATSTIS